MECTYIKVSVCLISVILPPDQNTTLPVNLVAVSYCYVSSSDYKENPKFFPSTEPSLESDGRNSHKEGQRLAVNRLESTEARTSPVRVVCVAGIALLS